MDMESEFELTLSNNALTGTYVLGLRSSPEVSIEEIFIVLPEADAPVASLVRRSPATVVSSNMLGFLPQRRTLRSDCEANWRREPVAPF
jgi:hypothetical protein